jgi:hypothetical protein
MRKSFGIKFYSVGKIPFVWHPLSYRVADQQKIEVRMPLRWKLESSPLNTLIFFTVSQPAEDANLLVPGIYAYLLGFTL